MKINQIVFIRPGFPGVEQLVVIQFTHTLDIPADDNEPLMAAFIRGITSWVETTETGKDAWEDSMEDLNIADFLNINDSALDACLVVEGIYKVECVFRLSDGMAESYDRVLAEPNIDYEE